MRQIGRAVGVLAVTGLFAAMPASAQTRPATAMDGEWHFMVAPYFWFSGLDGTVSMKGIAEVPVEASFSDIWDNFDIGLLGRFEGRKNRWGFGVDLMYLNLGASIADERPILGQLGLQADLRQVITEGFATYRAVSNDAGGYLDLMGGVRYVGTSTKLTGEGPAGANLETTKQTINWLDGLAGIRFRVPLGSKVGLMGRTDVAGFGSDFTLNLQGRLDVALGERWALGAGYRYLDIDYDKGDDRERRLYKVAYDGPYMFVAYSW